MKPAPTKAGRRERGWLKGLGMADWITTKEAAELTGYHRNHVLRLLETGRVKAQKWGIQWQVSRSSLLAYVKKTGKLGGKRGPKTDT